MEVFLVSELNPLNHPICFSIPNRVHPLSGWQEHVPFAMFLVDVVRPKLIVELGTHYGTSYCAFCQAVKELRLDTHCYAIDSWKGDAHTGSYGPEILAELHDHHDPLYGSFSNLIQCAFDDAIPHFKEGTIDILHIDGYHTYEAVKHDFESWLPKLREDGIVLFHDTNQRVRDFGVWKFWDEIKSRYPHFEFLHCAGLGVLAVNKIRSEELENLFDSQGEGAENIRMFFFRLGHEMTNSLIISNKDQELRSQFIQTSDKNIQINTLEDNLEEKNQRLTELNNSLQAKDSEILTLNHASVKQDEIISAIVNSFSWRITWPLRFLGNIIDIGQNEGVLGSVKRRLVRVIINIYSNSALFRRCISLSESISNRLIRPWFPGLHNKVFMDSKLYIKRQWFNNKESNNDTSFGLYSLPKIAQGRFCPKISVIVPNYNHAKYLRKRLESVYRQTYQNIEVILLDDASNDESTKILEEYHQKYPDISRCYFNKNNSGGVFHQWKKGIELAQGELIWIAESDDYCSENLLEELVKFFNNEAVMLAFSKTIFIEGETSKQIWSLEEYLAELIDPQLWSQMFIRSAHQLVNGGWAVKNIVPNVSGAIFRNIGKFDLLDNNEWRHMTMCGDWIFYLNISRGGLVGYTPNATNYFRMHKKNTSVENCKKDIYYQEHEKVAKELVTLFHLQKGILEKQQDVLKSHWKVHRTDYSEKRFLECYSQERIRSYSNNRKPNLLMVTYALAAGGGETFPIKLANLLKSAGYSIALLNCHRENTEPGVRNMLRKDIPLLELDRLDKIDSVVNDLGVEIIHSHHAWVDVTLCTLLEKNTRCKMVITTHGMYEMMPNSDLARILPLLAKKVNKIVYTAEKNLNAFSSQVIDKNKLIKIGNALDDIPIMPIPREQLGINKDDFVLCMVSRAIPEKGWEESIETVKIARKISRKEIHLLLIGEGPEYKRLKHQNKDSFIHFLGFKPNIRDYFAASDIGFLPSRFRGESFPLVVIDCLRSNRPILASNIGEIANMITADSSMAGSLFSLDNWRIPVKQVAELIARYAEDRNFYLEHLNLTAEAAKKFDPNNLLNSYDAIYLEVIEDNTKEFLNN
jgi:glycosyltransferase involved in cell wall biosynthesis